MKKTKRLLTIVPIGLIFALIPVLNLDDREYGVTKPVVARAELKQTEEYKGIEPPGWLEDYVIGVVASEMPVYFNYQALKAQAVASRTYGYRAYCNNKEISYREIGQAYTDNNGLRQRWGNNYEKNYNLVKRAVDETKNEIMVYDNQPILAVFSSASNGMTQSSENAWGSSLPYLKSVKSEGDKQAEVFYSTKTVDIEQAKLLLGVGNINKDNTYIISENQAGYVNRVLIGGKELSAGYLRAVMGLKSESFILSIQNNKLVFETMGYGHGVGMSQYGAEYMAQQGYNYKEILTYYYSDVQIIRIGRD